MQIPVGPELVGRVARVPSVTGRTRQRVRVETVDDIGGGRALVFGRLLYRADNPVYEGSSRGGFVTVVNLGVLLEAEEPGR